ncbi:MFS transporter [Mycolicibacterium sp. 018/SC-01/001]|uniref:MFS transporter n=1 Tax=Mycolicibacterium sp. 018/SC-01/001 TaxID=2592069 RepID=UPI00163DB26D|nr:MFS transporter [Mycolicibacterium sp. 018/SC-01/001]
MLIAPVSVAIGAPSVAIPSMATALGVPFGSTEWIISVWSLGSAAAMPLGGRVIQRWGLRRTLALAVSLLSAGSLVAATAPTLALVVAGRFLGGVGAGGVVICIYACVDQTLDRRGRVQALALVAVFQTTASSLGSLIGGVLTASLGWRVPLAVPALAIAMLLPACRLAAGKGDRRQQLDVCGATLLTILATAIIALLHSPSAGVPTPVVAVCLAVAVIASIALAFHVRRHPRGMIPVSVVAAPGFLPAAVVGLTLFAGYYGLLSTAPELLAREHLSAVLTGVLLTPAALCGVLTGPVLAAVWHRRQPLWQTTALLGMLTTVGALVTAWRPCPPTIIGGVAMATIGFAAAQVILVGHVRDLVAAADRPAAAGLFNFMLYGGGSVGPAVAGGLSAASLSAALSAVAAVTFAGTAISALTGLRGRRDAGSVCGPETCA